MLMYSPVVSTPPSGETRMKLSKESQGTAARDRPPPPRQDLKSQDLTSQDLKSQDLKSLDPKSLDPKSIDAKPIDDLNMILQGLSDGITVQDPQSRLVFANDAAAVLCGFRTAA